MKVLDSKILIKSKRDGLVEKIGGFEVPVGAGEYEFNTGYNAFGLADNRDHGLGYRFGLGGLYNITDNVALKAMARYVKFDKLADETEETDMMEYTAGVRYNF